MKLKIKTSKKIKIFFCIGISLAIAYEIMRILSAFANWPPEEFGIFIDNLWMLLLYVLIAIFIGRALETKKAKPKAEQKQ